VSIKLHHSLSLRTGVFILIGAALQTLLLSFYFYKQIYNEQLSQADHQIDQLVSTIESSAAVAAYLDNQELAKEVVRGLASNDIVLASSLRSTSGMRIDIGDWVSADGSPTDESKVRHFKLVSPFMPDESTGEILLRPNNEDIEDRANTVARVYVLTLVAHSLGLTLLVILLINGMLTRPLKKLAELLHSTSPGSSDRLPMLRGHRSDEVGQLVSDTNELLDSVQITLEEERRLRLYVESVEKRFRLIFEEASCGIALVDDSGRITLSNPSFDAIMSSIVGDESKDTLKFVDLFEDVHLVGELLKGARDSSALSQDLQLASPQRNSRRWLHALFSPVRDEQDELLIECILYDISERARREQRIRQEAERDSLTQLYNRRAGERLLEDALQKAHDEDQMCALMLIDLDRFKPINDTYGHEAGDKVLVSIAERMKEALRDGDLVIRWGGDEFLVFVCPGTQIASVSVIAQKLLDYITKPIEFAAGCEDYVGASIGISLYPQHGDQLSDLINQADKAMYKVKQRGRNHFQIFEPTDHDIDE